MKRRLLPFIILTLSLLLLFLGRNTLGLRGENLWQRLSEDPIVRKLKGELNQALATLGAEEIPDIPIYPGSSQVFFVETVDQKKGIKVASAVYHLQEDFSKAADFFIQEMAKRNWLLARQERIDLPGTTEQVLSFTREGASCRVSLNGQEGVKATVAQVSLSGNYQTVPATAALANQLKELWAMFLALPAWVRWSTILGLIFLASLIFGRRSLYSQIILLKLSLLYSALAGFFLSAYLFVTRLLQSMLRYSSPLISILFLLFVIIFFLPLKNALERLIDSLFFKKERKYRIFLQEFSQSLTSLLSLSELSNMIVETIRKLLNLRYAFLLFYEASAESFSLLSLAGELKGASPGAIFEKQGSEYRSYPSSDRAPEIIWKSRDNRGLIRQGIFSSVFVYQDQERLHQEFATSVPLHNKGKLIGVLNLGPKTSRRHLAGEELNLLTPLANQTAIALENARLYQETLDKERMLNQLMQAAQQAHEEERRRISRDLHDSVAQNLSGLILNLDFLKKQVPKDNSKAQKEIKRIEKLIKETVSDLRRLIYDLRPTTLDSLGLIPTLKRHIEQFGQENRLKTSFSHSLNGRLPANVETALFRLTQEALNNVKKHSQAKQVNINMAEEKEKDTVSLVIEDDGKGFELEKIEGGLGLVGMRERAESLGGKLDIISQPDRGTKILVTIPREGAQWAKSPF